MSALGPGLSGAVDRITRMCAQHDEERPLRIALVEEIRRTVSFGAYVWALTDPETEVGTSPLADVPQRRLPGPSPPHPVPVPHEP